MRKSLIAVAFAAAATVIAGCSSDSVGTGPAGADKLRSIFDQAMAGHSTVTETFSDSGGTAPGTGQQTCKISLRPTKAADCVTQTPEGPFHTIATTAGMFISTPDAGHSGDKPWRKVDLHGSDPLAQTAGVSRANHGIFVPGAASVTGSTSDQVNGTPCTRYDLTYDSAKLFDGMLKQTGNDAMEQASQSMAKAGATATGKVWITKDNLPAQTLMQLTLKGQPTQGQSITYTNWDSPVTVQAPPAEQVSSN